MKDGFLIIDKPRGITSHDVVVVIRKKFYMRRVGHAGTLDPLATGVLIILVGRSTKLFEKFSSFDKSYEATLRLGITTNTADINGKILKKSSCENVTRERMEELFKQFSGTIEQIPPMISAIKIKGKRLYKLARAGIEVNREPRKVTIKELRIIDFSLPEIKFYVRCSKGTYIRKIAEDMGQILGCGGCISQIKRTQIGPFSIDETIRLEDVNESHLRHWAGEKIS